MQVGEEKKQLKPYHGIVLFALVVLATIFVAAPIQTKWGMYGVALTELMILLLGLIPAILLKTNLRQVFPIKKPMFRQIIGTIIFWFATYLLVILVTLIITYLFPEELTNVSNVLQNTITSVPAGIAFLIIAVMPAMCEEILHRGFILNSLASLKSKWLIILIMGVIFGIFHLDLYRFLPTAILGIALTYIMLETQNIIFPMLFHLINNSLSTFVSFLTQSQTAKATPDSAMLTLAMATYFILGAIIPFLLLLGAKLIHPEEPVREEDLPAARKRKNKAVFLAAICAVVMVVVGVVIITTS